MCREQTPSANVDDNKIETVTGLDLSSVNSSSTDSIIISSTNEEGEVKENECSTNSLFL